MSDTQNTPAVPRVAVAIVGCGAIVGVVALTVAQRFRPQFEAWVAEDLRSRVPLVMGVLAIATAGPLLGMGAYLWREATSAEGRRRNVLRGVAVTLALSGVILALLLWRLTALLGARISP